MKKTIRFLSLLLVIATIIGTIPTHAFALSPSYTVSNSYKNSSYYTALQNVELKGDQRKDIVAIARSQVGYTEGNSKDQLSGYANGSRNFTEYGNWYKSQDLWCAMFVSWCAEQAQISTSIIEKTSYTVTALNKFISQKRAYTRAQVKKGDYEPKAGDIIFFKGSRNNAKTNHVGIVTDYSNGRVYTIEGNTAPTENSTNGGGVYEHDYSINDTYIVYICNPNYTNSSNLKISVTSAPVSINEGDAFGLRGEVTSQYKITLVEGAVYNKATGQRVLYSVDQPYSTTMSIKTAHLNDDITFNTLSWGDYTLKVTATDTSGKTTSWSQDFEVRSSYIVLGMSKCPGYPGHETITYRKCFGLRGWINSSHRITCIKGEILKGSKVVDYSYDYPNKKDVDVQKSNLNNHLNFNLLKRGSYTLRISVTTSSGQSHTWSKNFTVK